MTIFLTTRAAAAKDDCVVETADHLAPGAVFPFAVTVVQNISTTHLTSTTVDL